MTMAKTDGALSVSLMEGTIGGSICGKTVVYWQEISRKNEWKFWYSHYIKFTMSSKDSKYSDNICWKSTGKSFDESMPVGMA